MFKLFELLYRRGDMTHAAAMDYWTDAHAPLIREQNRRSGLIRRYLNNVGIPLEWRTGDGPMLPFDGVMEARLDIEIAQFRTMLERTGNDGVSDEANFLSARPTILIVEADTLKPFAAPFGCKLLLFWRRRPELTFAEAERIWVQEHAPAERETWGDALRGLVLNRCRPFAWSGWGEEMPPYDGVAEYYFDFMAEELPERWTRAAEALGAGLRRFAGDVRPMCVREVVQVGEGQGPA